MKSDATTLFIQKAKNKHGDKYNYDLVDYKNSKEKVIIICPKHGEFEQTPNNHLRGASCLKCAREKIAKQKQREASQQFVAKAQKIHGERYSYDLVDYKNSQSKIIILCPSHGAFEQKANNHLNGAGCPSCGKVKQGWSRSTFVAYAKRKYGGKANLYIIKCFDHGETFYKIGITAQSIIDRFKYNQAMPYQYTVLMFISGEASEIYDLEKEVHRQQRVYHYIPNQPFSGSALECFSKLTSLTCKLIKSSAYMTDQICKK